MKSGSGTQTFDACSLTNTGAITLAGGTLNIQGSTVNAPLAGTTGIAQRHRRLEHQLRRF